MLIDSFLFSRNSGNTPDLSTVLMHFRRVLLNRIAVISSLDEMTDNFLTQMIHGSLIKPLVLHSDRLSRTDRTVNFSAADFPNQWEFMPMPGTQYPKTVFRICVPFTGDAQLFAHAPNGGGFHPPIGRVYGFEVQFDVVLWGYQDDAARVRQSIKRNLDAMEHFVSCTNAEVRAYNDGLSQVVTEAFTQKFEKLSGQHAIFDDLGIPEKPKTLSAPSFNPVPSKPAKKARRPEQIIQFVQHTYVQTIQSMTAETVNQTNNNTGDVNNAIQPH